MDSLSSIDKARTSGGGTLVIPSPMSRLTRPLFSVACLKYQSRTPLLAIIPKSASPPPLARSRHICAHQTGEDLLLLSRCTPLLRIIAACSTPFLVLSSNDYVKLDKLSSLATLFASELTSSSPARKTCGLEARRCFFPALKLASPSRPPLARTVLPLANFELCGCLALLSFHEQFKTTLSASA